MLCINSSFLSVLPSIYLHHDSFFQADKVHDITPNGCCRRNLEPSSCQKTKRTPKSTLRISRVISKLSGPRSQSVHFPLSLPSPTKGGKELKCFRPRKPYTEAAVHLPLHQRQLLIHFIHRSLRVRAMLSRQSAAARMMRDLHQWQTGNSEELRFSPAQFHKNRLA